MTEEEITARNEARRTFAIIVFFAAAPSFWAQDELVWVRHVWLWPSTRLPPPRATSSHLAFAEEGEKQGQVRSPRLLLGRCVRRESAACQWLSGLVFMCSCLLQQAERRMDVLSWCFDCYLRARGQGW